MVSILASVAVMTLASCASMDRQSEQPAVMSGPADSPYAGVWLADSSDSGVLVRGVIAGPAAIAGLKEGDRMLRIDGVTVNASSATEKFNATRPGENLLLHVLRGDEQLEINLVMGSIEDWAPPSLYPSSIPFSGTLLPDWPRAADPAWDQALSHHEEARTISTRLDRMFSELARYDMGYHKLPLIRLALMNPGALTGWRNEMKERLRPFQFNNASVIEPICHTLVLSCPDTASPFADSSLPALAHYIDEANDQIASAFSGAGIDRVQTLADMEYLLRTTALERTFIDQPRAMEGIHAMRASMKVNLSPLLSVAATMITISDHLPDMSGEPVASPLELRGIVEGNIIDYRKLADGYIVIGGPGDNRYDMSRIHAVIDPDGDDDYVWSDTTPPPTQLLIDLKGNDRYRAKRGGPGAGWLGVSVLVDRFGNDTYQSELGGCGAGALGFGFLFDDEGTDNYQCDSWSIGSAFYGAGILVDRSNTSDVYLSKVFSQGAGGPRGMGILVDANGNDVYRANGPGISAYDVHGSFMSFSQGTGVGIRPYETGGVGLLFDYGGNDRYEGGEFAQGGGYLWGVGVLVDESGNDVYYGNRYAQGYAAHQAFGMLADLSGDDVYWSMSAAGQGAAWDQSIAILHDAQGDDVYRGEGLSQGAAAQQSRAMLHDVSGNDRYWASGVESQGAGGDNAYHFFEDDPVYSMGVLLDEQGDDSYSSGIENGETRYRRDRDRANGRGVAGLAIDRL